MFLPPFPFPDPLFCPPALALQAYPSGLPDEQLKLLGSLSRLYTPEEISRWWVTSSDTLSALLNPMYGKWGDAQVNPWQQRATGLVIPNRDRSVPKLISGRRRHPWAAWRVCSTVISTWSIFLPMQPCELFPRSSS